MAPRCIAPLIASAALVAACTGDTAEPAVTAPSTTVVVATAPPTTLAALEPEFADGPLADVCPATIVVQTESLPTFRLGPLYALLPASPTIDAGGQRVSGPLRRPDGRVEDVTLELRSGGPAVGFVAPLDVLDGDERVHLAITGVSDLLRSESEATAVVALAPGDDRALLWDPTRTAALSAGAVLGGGDAEVHHQIGEPMVPFLAASGAVDSARVVSDGDDGLAAFIASDGAIIRDGDRHLDVALLAALAEWDRPVDSLPSSELGWDEIEPVIVSAADERLSDDCLGRLVPIVQRAVTSWEAGDRGPVNELMSDIRTRFDPLNRVSAAVLGAAADSAGTSAWVSGVGSIDPARVDRLAEVLDVDDRAEAVTDRFLDGDL